MLDDLVSRGFECRFESHAAAILEKDFPDALTEITNAIGALDVPITEIVASGGGEAKGTQRMRRSFAEVGWTKKVYEITKVINGRERESTSHEVDHVKAFVAGEIALEIEWNNKDPFFDRDLENFKRLHNEGAISVGVIVTRGTSLHDRVGEFVQRFADEHHIGSFEDLDRLNIELTRRKRAAIAKRTSRVKNPVPFSVAWRENFVSDKYGEATTHWRKLIDRIQRGVGNPCPLLLIGLPASIVSFPPALPEVAAAAIERANIENAEQSGEADDPNAERG
jgi:hypothetical protein